MGHFVVLLTTKLDFAFVSAKMKYLIIALTISMAVAYANGLSCWTCPYTGSGEDECLTSGDSLGESTECSEFQKFCETLAIDDESAPLRYNRRCAPHLVQKGAQRLISKPQTVTSIQEEYASAIVETTATPKFKDIIFYSATKYYL